MNFIWNQPTGKETDRQSGKQTGTQTDQQEFQSGSRAICRPWQAFVEVGCLFGKQIFLLITLLTLASCSGSTFAPRKMVQNSQAGTSPPGPTPPGTEPPPLDKNINIKPSKGTGGSISPGGTGQTANGATIYAPRYTGAKQASSVIVLFNLDISDFATIADRDNIFLLATNSYNDRQLIADRFDQGIELLSKQYNIDLAKIYLAGWSAGGNIALIDFTAPEEQAVIAGIMVFPGTGGNYLRDNLKAASQSGTRKIAIHYSVGDQDTQTGFYPGCVTEHDYFIKFPGYGDRIGLKVWQGSGHGLPPQSREDAWKWIQKFNSVNN